MDERTKRAMELTDAALAARVERVGSVGQGTPDVDVSAIALEFGAEWRVLFSPWAWAVCAPRGENTGRSREEYARAVLGGMLARVSAGRGGQAFKFSSAPLLPLARSLEVVFEAECIGEGDEALIRVRVAGEASEVRNRPRE